MVENNKFTEYTINNAVYRLAIFNKVETAEQAYLLGYLFGDGIFHHATHKRKERMGVSSSNKEIINKFQSAFCPDSTIHSLIPTNKTRNIVSTRPSYILTFSSKFSSIFRKTGILDLKVNRTVLNIPKKHMNSFLLGVLDSDGNISFGFRKDRRRLWANFRITHPSPKGLGKIQKFLLAELKVGTAILPKGNENCLVLQTAQRNDVATILKFIYTSKSTIYNKTKKKKSFKYLRELKKNAF